MDESLREVAKALYEVGNSLSCKVCVKCKEKRGNENLSCVDCIEDGLKNLIERATPKRPKYEFWGEYGQFTVYHCPICNHDFGEQDDEKYCPDCGQRLDLGRLI